MTVAGKIWVVVASTLATALVLAWVMSAFLTTEAAYLFFFVGGVIGLLGSLYWAARPRRQ